MNRPTFKNFKKKGFKQQRSKKRTMSLRLFTDKKRAAGSKN